MAHYTIIIYTNVLRPKDGERIFNLKKSFSCIMELSVDLTDCDNVLRIVSAINISWILIDYLEMEDIKCKLMGVYQKVAERVMVIFEREI